MSKKKALYGFVFAVILAACSRAEGPKSLTPDCDIHAGPCVRHADGMTVTFEITPRPVYPMRNVSFSVLLELASKTVDDAEVTVDLVMPDMYMGKNKYELTHAGDGVYHSEGVLPRCPKGGKLWRSMVTVHWADSGLTTVPYLFEVR